MQQAPDGAGHAASGYLPLLGRVVRTARKDGEAIVIEIATETVTTTGATVVQVVRGPAMKVVKTALVMVTGGGDEGIDMFRATLAC